MTFRSFWFSIVAIAGLLGCFVLVGLFVLRKPYRGFAEAEKIVDIDRGDSARLIAYRMKENGIVPSATLFYTYLRLTGKAGAIKAGEYQFTEPMTMAQVAKKLIRGDVYRHKVTIPEGLIFQDIKPIFLREGFGPEEDFDGAFNNVEPIVDLDRQAKNVEGYLFPETYLLSRRATPQSILLEMVRGFRRRFDSGRIRRSREMGMTVRQAVTLASLIEKETALDNERYLVSSVYHNRLKEGMLLACDPTVIYAIRLIRPWDGVIHQSDLQLDSPYNTYRQPGLPPGPIANPGLKAIDAALHPADTGYLYFVSRNDGSHAFSENLEAHNRAVEQYRRAKSAGANGHR
ncbi:MAG TPA: endolytic transglycosylase MltG [Acidobacteriota bacterium]|jgi:UPF0755 protein